jgi:molecular chaperone HtpG
VGEARVDLQHLLEDLRDASSGSIEQTILTEVIANALDSGFVEQTIRDHFEPLIDVTFDVLLRRHYPYGVLFEVDGRTIPRLPPRTSADRAPLAIRLGRRRTPSAVGYLVRHASPLADGDAGVAISTFGKVIKRGWEWLGLSPAGASRVSGLLEAPELAACLTINKSDFIRSGPRGATYLAYRKAIQEVVSRQLATWGDTPDTEAHPRPQRLERDLARVLEDLADDFPLLRSLVDRRPGGQKRLPIPGRGVDTGASPLFDAAGGEEGSGAGNEESAAGGGSAEPSSAESEPQPDGESEATPPAPASEPAPEESGATASLSGASGRKRPGRYGLLVQFESRPDDPELGRLVDSTLWVNDAHPAYLRAAASRSTGYHLALSVALALAPLAVEPAAEHAFVTQFLAHWGDTSPKTARPRRRRR